MNATLRNVFSIMLACGSIFFIFPDHSHGREVKIPDLNEWQDRGDVLRKGPPGSWDARLTGMVNPCTVIKKNGTFFLYYIGAKGNRTTDGGPAFRALGVATSKDGLKFTKYSKNPVLIHIPHDNQEEGVFSAGSSLDEDGNIVLHYGAMLASDRTSESVRAQIALATSVDGYHFQQGGYVVRWDDPDVWGNGDEIFPVGSLWADNTWYVYYTASGPTTPKWSLGLVYGSAANALRVSKAVVSKQNFFDSGGDPVLIDNNKIALFIETLDPRHTIEIRTASLDSPERLSAPVVRYSFAPPPANVTVCLDKASGTWYMYFLSGNGESIQLKTAPLRYVSN